MESCEECAPGYLANDTGSTWKSTTIDLASSEDLEGMKVDNVSPLGHGVVVQERVYLLPRQLDEKVEKFTFRHSARSSPSLTENKHLHRVIVLASSRFLNWGAPLASFLHGAGAA